MLITINGAKEELDDGITLLGYIESIGLDPMAVVAELNLEIVEAKDFADIRLAPDDSLELLHFVGGG